MHIASASAGGKPKEVTTRLLGEALSSPGASGYDRIAVVPEEELRARAVLSEMLMRVSQGPHAALGISEAARAEEVRAAFLALTKQFHPARFGRMSADLHKLANEVFLGIKTAHDQLVKQLGSSGRPPTQSTTGVLPVDDGRGTTRGNGVGPRTGSYPPLARGTDRPGSRPSTPGMTPGSGRPSSSPRPRSPSVVPSATGPQKRVGTPALGVPTRRPTPVAGTQPLPRPTSPYGAPRPGTPPTRKSTPPSDPLNPPTIRYSGVQPTQKLSRTGPFDEEGDLRRALDLLSSKQWTAGRQALHALASKVPQSKRYRSLLCYARGRETQATGRIDDAVLEFQRALQLDPDLEIARQALRELGRKSRF